MVKRGLQEAGVARATLRQAFSQGKLGTCADAPSPKLAIIITAYKRQQYLQSAVRSALNQSIPRNQYEVVVIMGFRNAQIESQLESLAVPFLFDDSPGIGAQILLAAAHTKAPLIAFLDDDDEFVQSKVELVLKEFQNCPGAAYYHNNTLSIDEFGRERPSTASVKHARTSGRPHVTHVKRLTDPRRIQNYLKATHAAHFSSCIVVTRSLITETQSFISRLGTMATDVAMFAAALRVGGDMILDERHLTRYRVHAANITRVPNRFSDAYLLSELTRVQNELKGWSLIADFLDQGNTRALANPFRLIAEMHAVQLDLLKGVRSRRMYLSRAQRMRSLIKGLGPRWSLPSLLLTFTATIAPSVALTAIRVMDAGFEYWPSRVLPTPSHGVSTRRRIH